MREENDQNLYCLDFNQEGTMFATAGKDSKVRIYDDQTKHLACTLHDRGSNLPGHSLRVYCVKFSKTDSNILVSGGWDNTI